MPNKHLGNVVVSATRRAYTLSDGTTHPFIPPLPKTPKLDDIQRFHALAVELQQKIKDHYAAKGGIKWTVARDRQYC